MLQMTWDDWRVCTYNLSVCCMLTEWDALQYSTDPLLSSKILTTFMDAARSQILLIVNPLSALTAGLYFRSVL